MANVTCSRCGNTAAGLDPAPLPGKIGEQIRDQVCAACWREWMGMQVKVINEYRLSPAEPKHFDFLLAQMKAFVNLKDESAKEPS
jgi:Fe-S cluster biosynthesis and repair protein YggX